MHSYRKSISSIFDILKECVVVRQIFLMNSCLKMVEVVERVAPPAGDPERLTANRHPRILRIGGEWKSPRAFGIARLQGSAEERKGSRSMRLARRFCGPDLAGMASSSMQASSKQRAQCF